ncbi:MAG TPA: 23S rRNA (uracil(1939)-C(5))-methyltransferase RlmD [Chitinophagaceae bacterium]|nr:23S rRNA (uracil(1939)-C(5))-methyltransferase RlmD [Chitinophagaceae bacterium]
MKRKKQPVILEDLLVEDYAAEGKSLARVEGKVVFVDNAVPGDRVDLRLQKSKKDWAEGTAVRFRAYSPDRVEPFCPHFGVCGGCQWQMLPYDRQLAYKQRQVTELLRRIGKVALPEPLPILGARPDQTRYYRNKIEYTFGTRRYLTREQLADPAVSAEGPVAGFHAKGFFDKLVDIDTCYLQAEPGNAIRRAIRQFGIEQGYSFYDIRQHRGLLRTLQIRLCTTGELMVNLVLGEEDAPRTERLLAHLARTFPQITTLLYTINTKFNDSLHDLEPVAWTGPGYVIEQLEDYRFKIGPLSFFQTNTRQAEQLYRVTRDFAGLSGRETVYDLYCGTGSIGIFLSGGAARVIGVEVVAAAVEDARENARLNGLTHTAFFPGDVAEVCTEAFFAEQGRPDVIITDPPRAGMSEKLVRQILAMEAPVVVYVSCNPATQARDLAWLDEKYEVTHIRPVDMFPHTHHIENVVRLQRR